MRLYGSILLTAALGALAACGPTPTPPTLPPQSLPGECFRSATVTVYADLDGDGQRDAEEPPLEGITVGILRGGDTPELIDSADTSADGTAEVGFISNDEACGRDYLIGTLVMPGEYAPPANPLRRFGEVWESGGDVAFGLPPDEPARTATPVAE